MKLRLPGIGLALFILIGVRANAAEEIISLRKEGERITLSEELQDQLREPLLTHASGCTINSVTFGGIEAPDLATLRKIVAEGNWFFIRPAEGEKLAFSRSLTGGEAWMEVKRAEFEGMKMIGIERIYLVNGSEVIELRYPSVTTLQPLLVIFSRIPELQSE